MREACFVTVLVAALASGTATAAAQATVDSQDLTAATTTEGQEA